MPEKDFSSYGPTANVIYQVDLTDPSGFFLLKGFTLRNRDLIYIANSSLAEVRKFATLVSSTAAPVAQAASVSNTLSDLGN
jgi:polysaccharide export outer membrane protein